MDSLTSILGDIEHPGVKEDRSQGFFEFYVAGSTQKYKGQELQMAHEACNRVVQMTHMSQFAEIAGLAKKPPVIYDPFGREASPMQVRLIPEPENKIDPNAILIELFGHGDGLQQIIGWVPRQINIQVKANLHRIGTGWVRKVKERKLKSKPVVRYTIKVAFPYTGGSPKTSGNHLMRRALAVMSE